MRRLCSTMLMVPALMLVALGAAALTSNAASAGGERTASPTEARPFEVKVPAGYDAAKPTPLVLLLHGYTSNGAQQAAYFGLFDQADESGFLLAYPDGTRDWMGNRFWSATDACCDFYGRGVDDVAYLDAVLDDLATDYNVDPARIYVAGHSNGAFMAHRYACDRAARVAAIVTLAGTQWADPGKCGAGSPVSVLHVHGTDDETIRYTGGSTPKGYYPGAHETVATWAAKNSCTGELMPTGQALDLDRGIPGDDTGIDRIGGCAGLDVELWSINDGRHVPAFTSAWAGAIWDFMAAHPKG